MEEEKKVIIGYKGFDKDLKCRDFQYEVGKEYECEKAIVCEEGFHFCENLTDVFYFYPPSTSEGPNRFCKVIGGGEFSTDGKRKIACTDIKIVSEITPFDFNFEGFRKYGNLKDDNNIPLNYVSYTRDQSVASTYLSNSFAVNYGTSSVATGIRPYSSISSNGMYSVSACTGYSSIVTASGEHSIAASTEEESASYTKNIFSTAVATGSSSSAVSEGTFSVASCTGSLSSHAIVKGRSSIAACTSSNCTESITNGEKSISALTGNDSSSIANGKRSASVSTGELTIAKTKGEKSVALTVGIESSSLAYGKSSVAISTGIGGKAAANGENSIAIVTEKDGIASGALGSWIVFVEKDKDGNITDIKPFKVDNETVFEDCLYRLVDGELEKIESKK